MTGKSYKRNKSKLKMNKRQKNGVVYTNADSLLSNLLETEMINPDIHILCIAEAKRDPSSESATLELKEGLRYHQGRN